MREDFKNAKVVFNGEHTQLPKGSELLVEGYWDEVTKKTWLRSANEGNIGATIYSVRVLTTGLSMNNEVLYTHYLKSGLGHLVNISEVERVK
jgi:hypothetical protein